MSVASRLSWPRSAAPSGDVAFGGGDARATVTPGRAGWLRLQTDLRLVGMARKGNRAAFLVLADRHRARLESFGAGVLASDAAAPRVVDDALAAARVHLIADPGPVDVLPCLYRAVRRSALDRLRDGPAAASAPVAGAAGVLEDVRSLPEPERTALLLRTVEARSYGQIAQIMDASVPSVQTLIVRARLGLARQAQARSDDA